MIRTRPVPTWSVSPVSSPRSIWTSEPHRPTRRKTSVSGASQTAALVSSSIAALTVAGFAPRRVSAGRGGGGGVGTRGRQGGTPGRWNTLRMGAPRVVVERAFFRERDQLVCLPPRLRRLVVVYIGRVGSAHRAASRYPYPCLGTSPPGIERQLCRGFCACYGARKLEEVLERGGPYRCGEVQRVPVATAHQLAGEQSVPPGQLGRARRSGGGLEVPRREPRR